MKIYTVADNIISPLGTTTEQNYAAILSGKSGVAHINDKLLHNAPFYGAKISYSIPYDDSLTRLENMFVHSVQQAIHEVEIDLNRTVLVLSSTKGNIDQLHKGTDRVNLSGMAQIVNNKLGMKGTPVLVSNACISGVSALLTARNLIKTGRYDHAIVSGGDLLSKFTLSGFQCLKAVSENPCKPYDESRDGINLGEGVGTMVLSNNDELTKNKRAFSELLGGGQSNDANHISGPSRTGAGLNLAITKAMSEAGVREKDVDFINAHGTATLFNDEMESIAFNDLGFEKTPLNSLKGYFGHTLGAAGVIESILTIRQMNSNTLVPSLGFSKPGVSRKINVIKSKEEKEMHAVLKTVSGFGGCNAAILFKN